MADTEPPVGSLPKLKMAPFFLEEEGSDELGPTENGVSGSEEDSRSSQKDLTEFSTDSHTSVEDFKGDFVWPESYDYDKLLDEKNGGAETEVKEKELTERKPKRDSIGKAKESGDEGLALPNLDEELAQEELRQIHQRKDSKGTLEDLPPYKLQREREAAMTEEEEERYFKHDWPKHEKHIFILSSAGKPVYSRYVVCTSPAILTKPLVQQDMATNKSCAPSCQYFPQSPHL